MSISSNEAQVTYPVAKHASFTSKSMQVQAANPLGSAADRQSFESCWMTFTHDHHRTKANRFGDIG